MDDCKSGDQNGWCFKGSVGNNLPDTFFSYTGQKTQSDGIAVTDSGSSSSSSSSSQGAISTTKAASSSSPSQTSTSAAAHAAADSVSTSSAAASTATPGASCKVVSQKNGKNKKKRSLKVSRRRHHQRNVHDPMHTLRRRASSSKSQGYQDGYNAAKKFASMGGSKIGFKLQYIKDTAGDKASESYINDFMQGAKDAETEVNESFQRRR